MWHAWNRIQMGVGFWSKKRRERKPVRPRRRWKDNITIYLTEVRFKGVNLFSGFTTGTSNVFF